MVTALFWVAPKIEASYFPVTSNLEFVYITENDSGEYKIYGEIDKNRSCVLKSISMITYDREGDIISIPVYRFDWNKTLTTGVSVNRPVGHSKFGPWFIPIQNVPHDLNIEVNIIFEYQCTILWNTIEIYGPINLNSVPRVAPENLINP